MREAFRAAVTALELADDTALLKAMGRGQLEATVDEHDRAAALAPPDVQADIDERATQLEDAKVHARIAGGNRDSEAQAEAETQAQDAAEDLARLAVADAARREWSEAHSGLAAKAEAAEGKLPGPRAGRADPGHGRRSGRGQPGAARDPGYGPGTGPGDPGGTDGMAASPAGRRGPGGR